MVGSCPYLLFAYFLGSETPWSLYYSYSSDGLHWTGLNGPANPPNGGQFPVLNCTSSSLRDPYMNVDAHGVYHLIATDGDGFGGTPNILYWNSTDGIQWSTEVKLPVMGPQFFPSPDTIVDTWAPEWAWDDASQAFMVYWAAKGTGIMPILPSPSCTGTTDSRFAFFRSYALNMWDISTYSQPVVFFDPGCYFEGVGGIDGDIVMDPASGNRIFFFKDARNTSEAYRGIRAAISDNISGPYLQDTVTDFLAPTLVEAPQLVQSPDNGPGGHLLYFDCSFWPTPKGWPRPPFGVAHTSNLTSLQFDTYPGSCTGNSSALAMPWGATHGSFICINDTQLSALQAAFPS